MMRDIPEFAYLKSFEAIFTTLEAEGKILPGHRLETICAPYSFTEEQGRLLKVMLLEMGYRIE